MTLLVSGVGLQFFKSFLQTLPPLTLVVTLWNRLEQSMFRLMGEIS